MATEMTKRVGGAILLAEMEWTPKSPLSKEETMARAAIEAMREPTEAMKAVGEDASASAIMRPGQVSPPIAAWDSMIDAALSE